MSIATNSEGPEYVLMTREVIGTGKEDNPHRTVLRFWDKETLQHITDYDPITPFLDSLRDDGNKNS